MNNDFFTIFVFPFKYETKDNKNLEPDKIAQKLTNGNTNPENGWAVEQFNLEKEENYNEYYYFHPFVRKAIFNRKENTGIEYLTRTDYKYLEVEYFYNDKADPNKTKEGLYTTEVKSVDLHLFDNQIGLLSITTEKCSGDDEMKFPDLLRYNDIARRVYPPYLVNGEDNTAPLKSESQLLPCRVTIFNGNDDKENISECFKSIPLSKEDDREIIFLSGIIKKLLSPFELKEKKGMKKNRIYYTPFTDDRMFTISYYADKSLSDKLKQRCCDGYVYETSDEWYRFIFVDGKDKGIENPGMQRELIQKHTYNRWVNYGTLFGFSRYSLVMLCPTDAPPYLKQHMKSMYYQMALIVLFQQAMLLKFSDDIADLLGDIDKIHLPEQRNRTNKLYGDFIKFINKYWFIEVTPQEQGVEMYNQWLGLSNLDNLYKEIAEEITALSEYLENKMESETNKKVTIITIVGLPLAGLGLILGLWQIYSNQIDKFNSIFEILKAYPLFSFELLEFTILGFVMVVFICKSKIVGKIIDWLTSLK